MLSSLKCSELQAAGRGIAAILLGVQLSTWVFFLPGAMKGHADFRHFYTVGFMIRTGQRNSLSDYAVQQRIQNKVVAPDAAAFPFNHLAYEALVFAPFSLFSYRVAYIVFLGFNLVMLYLALLCLRRAFPGIRENTLMALCFLPVPIALMQGQDSILLLLVFCATCLQLCYGKELLAGLLLGLGLFKFQLVIPVALLFLAWRRWRVCLGLITTTLLVVTSSVLLVGASQMRLYVHSLLAMGRALSPQDQVFYGILPNRMPNLRGLVSSLLVNSPATAQLAVLATLSIMLLCWFAIAGRRREIVQQLVLAVSVSTLVSHHLLVHDWSVLLLPITALSSWSVGLKDKANSLAWVLSMVFVSPLILLIAPNRFCWAALVPGVLGLAALVYSSDRRTDSAPYSGCDEVPPIGAAQ